MRVTGGGGNNKQKGGRERGREGGRERGRREGGREEGREGGREEGSNKEKGGGGREGDGRLGERRGREKGGEEGERRGGGRRGILTENFHRNGERVISNNVLNKESIVPLVVLLHRSNPQPHVRWVRIRNEHEVVAITRVRVDFK